MKKIDMTLGVFFALVVFVITIVVGRNISLSWPWGLAFLLTVVLVIWTWTGFRKIPIGYKAQLLFLGARRDYIFEEGWCWIPFPLSINTADCRETSMPIQPLEVLTSDNVEVKLEGAIVYKIVNLNSYFWVDPATITQTIKETWDEIIRTEVVDQPFDKVKKMHVELGEKTKQQLEIQATERWGIQIIKVPVTIGPTSAAFKADLELNAREELQKKGQMVEAAHVENLVGFFQKPKADGGCGMTHEEAVRQANLTTGKALPENSYALRSPEIAAAIAQILKGGKP